MDFGISYSFDFQGVKFSNLYFFILELMDLNFLKKFRIFQSFDMVENKLPDRN